ncbi:hypothetical protein ACIBCT_35825 [Streptosporangium sp. NPDC050855]|uniref:hypothetical protein n=1 Tax=Streptosporangium sp. NPDC050855 TaxID=3366194 RepID=UPI003789CC80
MVQLPGLVDRKVLLTITYGSRQLHVCETKVIPGPHGETVTEIVDYNPEPPAGRDPYGAGAVIAMEDLRKVIGALETIATRRGL